MLRTHESHQKYILHQKQKEAHTKLQLTATTRCTTLHHTARYCTTPHHTAPHCTTLHRAVAHCNNSCTMLQHTAGEVDQHKLGPQCATLKNLMLHTTTHCRRSGSAQTGTTGLFRPGAHGNTQRHRVACNPAVGS